MTFSPCFHYRFPVLDLMVWAAMERKIHEWNNVTIQLPVYVDLDSNIESDASRNIFRRNKRMGSLSCVMLFCVS